jgi:hypothetical protein
MSHDPDSPLDSTPSGSQSSNPYAAPHAKPHWTAPAGFPGKPHRGGLVLGMAIGGLVLSMISSCCCGVLGLPFLLVGAVLGGISGYLGTVDLQAIRNGTMDPSGQGLTVAGMAVGWVALGISVFLFLLMIVFFALGIGMAIFEGMNP